jgi:hypothetical protein
MKATKKAKSKKAAAPAKRRQYYFSFNFYVSGREIACLDIDGKKREPKKNRKNGKPRRQRGYFITIEVKAVSKQGAAQKIRNRITKMPDVQNVPEFHFSQVTKGLAVLESGGHNRVEMCEFARPGVQKPKAVRKPKPTKKEQVVEQLETAKVIDLHAAAMRRRSGGCMSY